MELCVGVEYMYFRATCKRCHLAAPAIQWSNKASLMRLHKYSVVSPWLMVVDMNRGIITFTDPLFGDKYFMKNYQILVRDRICCSRFGWLLLNRIGVFMFFNPFTSDLRKLPHLPPMSCYLQNLCFSAPPISSDCMVMGFTRNGEPCVYIHFLAREQTWRVIRLDFGGADPYPFCCPTFYGGDLYALGNREELYVFRNLLREEQMYSCKQVGARRSCKHNYLVKCDQSLLLVIVGKFGESVEVFKLNRKEWENVDCLGRYMIYICGTTCLCIEAKTPEIENKIYFPRLHSKKGNIVLYSLETFRFQTFNGEKDDEVFGLGIEHVYPHVWAELSWS